MSCSDKEFFDIWRLTLDNFNEGILELVRAMILKTIPYTDTQKIIRVYSREKGYFSLITPSLIFKRKNQPLHLLQFTEIEYFENEAGSLHKLRNASPLVNLPRLYFDIFKMNILLLWGEILNLLLAHEGKNEDLFDYIQRSVEYLNSTENDTANFNLFFLFRLAGLIGFRINTSSWQEGYVFNINDGCFYPSAGDTPYISGPNTAKIIYLLTTCPLEELKNIPLNRSSRNILLDIILLFYSIHLNVDFNIKSIQVIREIFAWFFPFLSGRTRKSGISCFPLIKKFRHKFK